MDRATEDEARKLLEREGVIDEDTKVISAEWIDDQWLFITDGGVYENGDPRFGHWFVDAAGEDWHGSFGRH